MAQQKKIESTRDYRMFHNNSGENRPLNLKGHRKLGESMKKYGFLESFPIVVARDKQGRLVVKDGQHRLAFAESLGLPVYWVEDTVNFDVAVINSSAKVWIPRDYAMKYAANGIKAYQEGLDFADRHQLPIGVAFGLLAGTVSFANIEQSFYSGGFKIKDKAWADVVASLYNSLVEMSPEVKSARMLEACMAVCRVPDFDAERLLNGARRCRERLVSYSTKESYLEMLENLYNFGRNKLVGLKVEATMAMRKRSATFAASV